MDQEKKHNKTISGFSKLSKRGKIKWMVENFFKDPEAVMRELMSYWHSNEDQQKILDGFSENTISNFPMPYGVAPNFVINGETHCVPMVIEESSVVAAASSAAKFWMSRGGFRCDIISTKKVGQVHFDWNGNIEKLKGHLEAIEKYLRERTAEITKNMENRGGGILEMEFRHMSEVGPSCYQLMVTFETCDSMGANFINSCLEIFGQGLSEYIEFNDSFHGKEKELAVVMCILSNYTPECLVRVQVECPISDLGTFDETMPAQEFAARFKTAVDIAHHDIYRATTHNKGIFNGIDAVVMATGNDFRAIEACGHTYASRSGQYRSLSHCSLEDDKFKFWMDIPLAVGTVGGLTSLHPMAKRSLELLGSPGAQQLMKVIAATGLAQNFAAVRSLVTTGIQKGHMKMHIRNILNRLEATPTEIDDAIRHFEDETVSFSAVRDYLTSRRSRKEVKA